MFPNRMNAARQAAPDMQASTRQLSQDIASQGVSPPALGLAIANFLRSNRNGWGQGAPAANQQAAMQNQMPMADQQAAMQRWQAGGLQDAQVPPQRWGGGEMRPAPQVGGKVAAVPAPGANPQVGGKAGRRFPPR